MDTFPRHGGQLKPIAERFGISASHLLDFSANINPDGPPTAVMAALRTGIEDISIVTAYPELELTELKDSIAQYAGVAPHNVIVANGFVPLLEAALRALSVRRCLLPVPAFVEYRKTLERAGVEIELQVANAQTLFQYDPIEMLSGEWDAILLANPQNPSGVCQEPSVLRELVEEALKKNIHVLLDEAFIDYVPDLSLVGMSDDFPNLTVFRSVTKFHGIPGLRVAYATTNQSLTASIDEKLPPWPITTLASRAVIAALGDQPYTVRSRAENLLRRTTLQRDLTSLGLHVYPAVANFLLFQLPPEVSWQAFWRHMIAEHRIVTRSCNDYEGLSENHFRVAVRTPKENSKLVTAIAESLSRLKRTSQG